MDLGGEEALSEEQRCAVLEASCLLPFLESELSRASFADMSSRCAAPLSLSPLSSGGHPAVAQTHRLFPALTCALHD